MGTSINFNKHSMLTEKINFIRLSSLVQFKVGCKGLQVS